MQPHNIIDLVLSALPAGIDPDEFTSLGKSDWWQDRPRLAVAYALRHTRNLDWNAYLDNNPDIAKAGVDPVWHFLREGIFEGRRLSVRHALVSIIVSNYNNSLYLGYALQSLVNQTLANIEIIVVDDASTDNSVQLIQTFAQRDSRICAILLEQNSSLHMTRVKGVETASGDYIMFLDADDYYASHACEVAYNAASKGHDLTIFNAQPFDVPNILRKRALDNYFNHKEVNAKTREEWAHAIFIKGSVPMGMPLRIIAAPLCKKAFRLMRHGYYNHAEDIYESLAVTSLANNICRIKDILYYYRCSSGTSYVVNEQKIWSRHMTAGDLAAPVRQWVQKFPCGINYRILENLLIKNSLSSLWDNVPEDHLESCLAIIFQQYPVLGILDYLLANLFYNWGRVAKVFKHFPRPRQVIQPKRIGFIYEKLGKGGIEEVIRTLCVLLPNSGYELTLFLHEKCPEDDNLPKNVKRIYLQPYKYDRKVIITHLTNLNAYLTDNPIDVMIFHRDHRKSLLWETILLHQLGIAVMLMEHSAYYTHFWYKMDGYFHVNDYAPGNYESVLKCLDKVLVLSRDAEAFYHARGINAQYVGNPVDSLDIADAPFAQRRNCIAVVCRLSEPVKQIGQTLLAFKEMLLIKPSLILLLAGSFANNADREAFKTQAERLEIWQNIKEMGWVNNPARIWEKASVLISTSVMESFNLSLVEAQTCGIPAVIYDLPIEPAYNNDSVITVPQGDYRALARRTLGLVADESYWRKLSELARRKSIEFCSSIWLNRFQNLLANFEKQSELTWHDANTYARITRTLAFFSGYPYPGRNYQ